MHENSPLFPFGFGLSYTTFTFGEPKVEKPALKPSDAAKVSLAISNTGDRAGDEVIQLYIHHPVSSFVQPVIMLRGFKRIHLEPKETATVTFDVGPEQVSILNAEMHRVVEPGTVDVLIGPNSTDTKKVQLVIEEESR